MKKIYYIYLGLVAIIPLVATSLVVLVALIIPQTAWQLAVASGPLITLLVILGFVAYWIQKYYNSISYALTGDEVVVERGVWWKMKHVVPYARVMSVDVIQGPISRRFGVGSVQVHTAGYTGPRGGTAGPVARGAEASIWGVPNFVEIRDEILKSVRGRPLFGAPKIGPPDVSSKMLEELRKIRKAVER